MYLQKIIIANLDLHEQLINKLAALTVHHPGGIVSFQQIRSASCTICIGRIMFGQDLLGQHFLHMRLEEVLCLTVKSIGQRFRLRYAQHIYIAECINMCKCECVCN